MAPCHLGQNLMIFLDASFSPFMSSRSGNPFGSTFQMDPKSNHFSPHPQWSPWSERSSPMRQPTNWFHTIQRLLFTFSKYPKSFSQPTPPFMFWALPASPPQLLLLSLHSSHHSLGGLLAVPSGAKAWHLMSSLQGTLFLNAPSLLLGHCWNVTPERGLPISLPVARHRSASHPSCCFVCLHRAFCYMTYVSIDLLPVSPTRIQVP